MQKFVYERSLPISGANTNCFAKKFLLRKVILGLEFYWKKNETKRRAGKTTGNLNLRFPIPLTSTSVVFDFLTNIVGVASYRKRCA